MPTTPSRPVYAFLPRDGFDNLHGASKIRDPQHHREQNSDIRALCCPNDGANLCAEHALFRQGVAQSAHPDCGIPAYHRSVRAPPCPQRDRGIQKPTPARIRETTLVREAISQPSHGISNHTLSRTLSRTKFEFDIVRDKVRDKGWRRGTPRARKCKMGVTKSLPV